MLIDFKVKLSGQPGWIFYRLSNKFENGSLRFSIEPERIQKIKIMKKLIALAVFAMFLLSSCEKYEEEVMPIVGLYEATISGVAGPFTMSIAADYGDNIIIEAPWLDDNWSLIDADVDEEGYYRMEINIPRQNIGDGLKLYGEGVFQDYSLQIDYTIEDGYDLYHYTLVGSKL